MTQPIFMIGARGAGKTTVGRALAQALGYDFVDTVKVGQVSVVVNLRLCKILALRTPLSRRAGA
jgi:cytidylate kinase